MRTTFADGEDPLSRDEQAAWEQLEFDIIVSGLGAGALRDHVRVSDVLRHPSVAFGATLPPLDLIRQHLGDPSNEK